MSAPKRVRIVLPVLIDGVSFPRKQVADHTSGALLELADDLTCERFQLAVSKKEARALEAAIDANEDDDGAEYATGTLVLLYPRTDDPKAESDGTWGIWLCAEKRLVTGRLGGTAEYDAPVAEEIARVLTELGHDAEAKELPKRSP